MRADYFTLEPSALTHPFEDDNINGCYSLDPVPSTTEDVALAPSTKQPVSPSDTKKRLADEQVPDFCDGLVNLA